VSETAEHELIQRLRMGLVRYSSIPRERERESAADACVHAALLDCRVKKKRAPFLLTRRADEKN
jgi:hypothetical protein